MRESLFPPVRSGRNKVAVSSFHRQGKDKRQITPVPPPKIDKDHEFEINLRIVISARGGPILRQIYALLVEICLKEFEGSVDVTARALGVNRRTMRNKIKVFMLEHLLSKWSKFHSDICHSRKNKASP